MFVLGYVVVLWGSLSLVVSESGCQSRVSSCGSCISYREEKCVWCPDDPMLEGRYRCQSEDFSNKTAGWCSGQVQSSQTAVEYRSTLEINVNSKGDKVHFYPQDILSRISPSSPAVFNVTYKLGRAYPLDVYLLVDYSSSMDDRRSYGGKSAHGILREKLKTIKTELINVTDNVYMGLGLFMEKPVLPYANSDALSYDHLVKLGNNIEEITNIFRAKDRIHLGGNNEDPEAGLDALLQAMVCKNELGWREVARRIIVMCTDAPYHSAGDGKMLGIITPCDETCRLVNHTYKIASKEYDYPSVGLINKVAREKNVQILFVAPEVLRRTYQALSKQVQGSVYVPLTGSFLSSISQEYEKSLRHPQLLILKTPPYIKVTIEPACNKQDIQECEVDIDQNKTVQVKVDLISCAEGEKEETVEIGLLGLDTKLTITVHPLCKCGCEGNMNSPSKCGNNGFLQCGVCKCNAGWSGELCDCNGEQMDATYLMKCKFKNDTETCSGRGDCRCGNCINCIKGYSGDFCEFDDEACAISADGKLCADHGKCTRGRCVCEPDWTGNDCGCPISNDICIPPYPRTECFGNGHCVCGRCVCNNPPENSETRYYGQFCQSSEPRCKELDAIVQCHYYNTSDDCSDTNNLLLHISNVNKTEFDELDQISFLLCTIQTEKGGIIKYRYLDFLNTRADKMLILVQDELEYPGLPVHVWAAIGSIIGTVVLVGLLTMLVWKILIDRRDAKEYAQYEEELKKQRLVEDNALYIEPSARFVNPMYNYNDY